MSWTGLGVVVGGAAVAAGWRISGSLRRPGVRRGAIAELGELSGSWVEIAGTVTNGADRTAPISGDRVVGYRVLVEREVGPLGWRPVVRLDEWPELEVADASGSAFVTVQGGRLDVGRSRGRGGPFRGIPARVARLLRAHGHGTHGVLFEKAFRWSEETITAGDPVRVRGFVSERPGGGAVDYRRLNTRRAVVGSTGRPVVVSRS